MVPRMCQNCADGAAPTQHPPETLRQKLRGLYYGKDRGAHHFRYGLVAFDIVVMGLFILEAFVGKAWWVLPLDIVLGASIALDFTARLYVSRHRLAHLLSMATLADIVVLGSLLLSAFVENLGFLRFVRTLRLFRSYHVLRDLRQDSPWFRTNEAVIQATLNLAIFIFVVTSAVFVTQHNINPGIATYIDALYFTITTLTTTGFGDITLQGPGGRLLAVIIMVVGVSLFLRLLQAVFRPSRVRYKCPDCGLLVHDIDAVHCKHCGRVLPIENEGFA